MRALFTIAKIGKKTQSAHWWMNEWIKNCSIHTHTHTHTHTHNGIVFSHYKGNHTICDNTDVPWANYAKWNKSDTEGKTLYDLIYMMNLKQLNS